MAAASGQAVVMQVGPGLVATVFDPDLDPDGRLAGDLTTLVAAFV